MNINTPKNVLRFPIVMCPMTSNSRLLPRPGPVTPRVQQQLARLPAEVGSGGVRHSKLAMSEPSPGGASCVLSQPTLTPRAHGRRSRQGAFTSDISISSSHLHIQYGTIALQYGTMALCHVWVPRHCVTPSSKVLLPATSPDRSRQQEVTGRCAASCRETRQTKRDVTETVMTMLKLFVVIIPL
jgi:hypothetical protein